MIYDDNRIYHLHKSHIKEGDYYEAICGSIDSWNTDSFEYFIECAEEGHRGFWTDMPAICVECYKQSLLVALAIVEL